jgi:hypothetical protein
MKYEQLDSIDHKARIWIVTRGEDGRLQEEFDPFLLGRLNPRQSAKEVADVLAIAAGEMEVAKNRLW